MRNRHIETEFWSQVGVSWVNGPIVGAMGIFKQIPEAKVASDANVAKYCERLDAELAATPYVAGERFTIADITLLTAIDFATSLVGLTIDESNSNLWRWHAQVSARDSVNA
jgi:glutathione S-transferase